MSAAREPETLLLEALLALGPTSVLAVGGAAAVAAEAFRARRPETVVRSIDEPDELRALADARYDAAAVSGLVGARPDRAARELLAALRDRHCDRVLLAAPTGAWPLTDYLALGFELRATGERVELYWYDVDRYNPEREWNNPEHWANPENFKRYRW